jgi:hypothetical protein
MVAWVSLHGIQEREDMAFVEDPFGKPIVGPRRADRGADVERREAHPRGEQEQRLHHQEASRARRRRTLERIA